jgi:hypothetical protein
MPVAVTTTPVAVTTGPVPVVVTGPATAGPLHVSSNIAEGRVGDTMLLSGAGFAAHETVYIHLNWEHVEDKGVIAEIQVNSNGSFSQVPVVLPYDGGYYIIAHGATSGREAETTIQIDK